ncbi:aspartate/glutamate racemase family protein [Streptomyces sp. P9(2023)]|uniref:aspartate/glutamate racemase family protein n=1 Tax=Streptomyces sp. P9(2023) TaxID=3064394 RepID=UPI0028F42715|nr:aspartate/glutamate racemase family protein [Streptomyces sp. P9(2023)]MDT9692074.1 aspartate/glutamate racemase family protein [Streptomyces sp. P9(2023)]
MLINPNTSRSTTAMMTAIARRTLGSVRGVTVRQGPPMLVDEEALRAAVPEVVAAGRRALAAGNCTGLLVGAFGDPGVAELRAFAGVPVVGLAEAACTEAAAGGVRFGVATTTPYLADAIGHRIAALGLADRYTGIRLTRGDAGLLAREPELLREELAEAVRACVVRDGARAVVIGGGPLAEAADALRERFDVPVVAPVPAACRRIARVLARRDPAGSGREGPGQPMWKLSP